MITKFGTFNTDNKNDILIIVDVQKEFSKFIQSNFVEELTKYANSFKEVYQIWDSNKAKEPSYKFPNEKGTFIKKFGTKFSKDFQELIKNLNQKYPKAKEGEIFKLEDTDAYVVKIHNNHGWFYVTTEMSDLFKKLKGKKVIVVGGGEDECLKDVFEALESFGVHPVYNNKFIYGADTNNMDKI